MPICKFTGAQIEAHSERLKPEHLEFLRLHYAQGLSYETIASGFAIPVGTVKSRLNRGRKALQNCIATATAQSIV